MASDHGPSCWAIHHQCARERIVKLESAAEEHAQLIGRIDLDVGKVERTKAYTEHWHTECDHLRCRISRLRRHYDDERVNDPTSMKMVIPYERGPISGDDRRES
mgnify:CR=1 FL=1